MKRQLQFKMHSKEVLLLLTQKNEDQEFFKESRVEEVQALLNTGCFAVIDLSAAEGQRVYRLRLVTLIKPDYTNSCHLCVAECHENGLGSINAAHETRIPSISLLYTICTTEGLSLHP